MSEQPDPFMLNQWFAISGLTDVGPTAKNTLLMGEKLSYRRAGDGFEVTTADGRTLPVLAQYACLWTSLGQPESGLFEIPQYHETDRRSIVAGSIGVNVSAQRGVENFLDMGHFPFVHTGILGELPHTEVKEYNVRLTEDGSEIIATECMFYQPMASTVSTEGMDVEYIYRVPHPTCSVLYKSSPLDEKRLDVIALFVQPIGPEKLRAHMVLSILDDVNADDFISHFQLHIFGQDKPILENQMPKRLPLDTRAETPIRADKSSIMYRRWLAAKGVTYGTIPAAA
ncbi:aromatic ring-hydroxylating dioxygenase subunit alpha [Xinfangfangia sp. CPCC 101601]|uniref:Aromatic ring-hydroxylating dioxygenase subunit alpha n=1 Tax=Pseudogemmobacter lacusdianii TaxID=3069608 RepID=A0ABU0VZ27_9RHOB|nr:aromatic ring-hydroxylating dioxygenase subunit alpha [Xinfangfangia sp. CPCC 101601]MDQ2066993.1 aromatic ring-hydroxylating dioxygenase subunit alpha [Xinfangfangia sp. CPCC 101601]